VPLNGNYGRRSPDNLGFDFPRGWGIVNAHRFKQHPRMPAQR